MFLDHQWRSQEFDLLGVYVLTSHCSFKTRVNVPHVNKTVTDFGGYIYRYTPPPVDTPLWITCSVSDLQQMLLHDES